MSEDPELEELLEPAADAAVVDEPIPPAARRPGLEAVLFLADEPVEVALLAELVDAAPAEVEEELEAMARAYEAAGSGIELRRAAGGWRMYTAATAAPVVRRFALLGRTGRLTQAALETLAVIAYKQPITRQTVSDIRGVNADGAVRSLVARGFVTEVGRDPGPGQAVLYGTTTMLLERLGLDSLDELPPLTEFLPEAPAPDEPDLARLKDVRRRLAAGEDLPSLGGRTAAQTNTGPGTAAPAEEDDLLPPPAPATRDRSEGPGIDELTDRLEAVARSAVGRLRAAVTAGDRPDGPDDEEQDPPTGTWEDDSSEEAEGARG
jgi:segregation and condensation protein B